MVGEFSVHFSLEFICILLLPNVTVSKANSFKFADALVFYLVLRLDHHTNHSQQHCFLQILLSFGEAKRCYHKNKSKC